MGENEHSEEKWVSLGDHHKELPTFQNLPLYHLMVSISLYSDEPQGIEQMADGMALTSYAHS